MKRNKILLYLAFAWGSKVLKNKIKYTKKWITVFACGSMIATITPKQGYRIIINNAVRVLRMVKICTQELN